MHTFQGPSGRYYCHHGDFSGDVKFGNSQEEWEVPFQDMVALVAEYKRRQQIADLEQQSPEEVLGLPG